MSKIIVNLRFVHRFFIPSIVFKNCLNTSAAFKCTISGENNEPVNKKEETLMKLQEILNIREYTAINIAEKHKKLLQTSTTYINQNHKICLLNNITNKTLIKYPEILIQKDLQDKLDLLEDVPHDINVLAPFLLLSVNSLNTFTVRYMNEYKKHGEDRIKWFADFLEADPEEICKAMTEKRFLQHISLRRAELCYEVLEEFNIDKEAIRRDYWVLNYNPELVRQRLLQAKQNNIENFKTWMVRAKSDIIKRYVTRRTDNRQILGNNSLAEYLAKRLECTVEQAKIFMINYPALKHKSMKRMKGIIDFLYARGFKPSHICRVPKILLHSIDTMEKRLAELEDLGMQIDSLHILTKSQKQYMQYCIALKKTSQKLKTK